MLDHVRDHRRHVQDRRQQVVGERRVQHPAALELDLLHHGEAEALRDAALDLTHDGDGVDRLPDVLRGRHLHHLHQAGLAVDVDDGAMDGEQERHMAVVLRGLVQCLRGPMPVHDGLLDRRGQVAAAALELLLDLARRKHHGAAGHPRLARG